MIKYKGALQLFFTREGSVLPFAAKVALPCALIAGVLKYTEVQHLDGLEALEEIFQVKNQAYGSFSSLLGFLVVFRTSQAYSSYWQGAGLLQQMTGSWFDAASSIHAFCRLSKADPDDTKRFQHLVRRLLSLLNALALLELEGSDEEDGDEEGFYKRIGELELIDIDSLDEQSLETIKHNDNKIELVFSWIQTILVDAMDKEILTIPAPVLARVFLQLGQGMVQLHECINIACVPFPFPYSQASLVLLIIHWLITPFMMCTWTYCPTLAAMWSFLLIFLFWALYAIAIEIQNPFGDDPNDLDAVGMQREFNSHLQLLARSKITPDLSDSVDTEDLRRRAGRSRLTLSKVWESRSEHIVQCHLKRRVTKSPSHLQL